VDVTAEVVLFSVPIVVPVTLTEKLHEALAESEAPDKATLAEPATAVTVPPPQFPERPLGEETVSPAGNVSVKATPLRELERLGFERLNVRVVEPLRDTVLAPKLFEMVGGKIVGGGGVPPEEPPPQETTKKAPNKMSIHRKATLGVLAMLPPIPIEKLYAES